MQFSRIRDGMTGNCLHVVHGGQGRDSAPMTNLATARYFSPRRKWNPGLVSSIGTEMQFKS